MDSKLVASWIEYHRQENGKPDLYWAWEELDNMVQTRPEQAWQYILEIVNGCSNERVLSNLAAGPLENLLVFHGADFIDQLEITARKKPRFVPIVKGVWQNSMPPSIWEAVHRIQIK